MKPQRTLILLAGLFVVMLVALTVQNNALNQPVTPAPQDTYLRLFPDIAAPIDIQAIRLQNPATNANFIITRDADGVWIMPSGETLIEDAGEQLAVTMTLLPYQQTFPILSDLETYGFGSTGRLLIQIVLGDGRTHAVIIGGLTSTSRSYYALVDEQEVVYVLERGAIDYLMAVLSDPPVA